MNQFASSCVKCKSIFVCMGADCFCPEPGFSSLDSDQWRVAIHPSEPQQVSLSFAEEVTKEDAVWIAIRFSALASWLGLDIVSVGSHERKPEYFQTKRK